jgi:phage gp46-like protein
MQILLRQNEANQPDPFLLWDTVQDADGTFDWATAGNAPQNSGGLAAAAALDTAVTLCLFSDAQMPAGHPLTFLVADGDMRGWWGDGIDVRTDLGEAPLGSLLWALKRAPLTQTYADWAEQFATDALSVLQSQGAVVRIDVSTTIGVDRLYLTVNLYGRDGSKVYSRQFDLIWQQLNAVPAALPAPTPPASQSNAAPLGMP